MPAPAIADVANSKCHQRLDEILIIFTRTVQEISKVVCKKTLSETLAFITSLCCMKRTHYSKRMLRKQDCVKFLGRIAWQSVFENNFADFSDVVGKKIKISSSHWWRFQLASIPTTPSLVAKIGYVRHCFWCWICHWHGGEK